MALLVNKTQGWGFIHIPKTGGTSITEILQHQAGTEKITGHDSIRRFEKSENLFIFTFVRNPYTRILSAYFHGIRKGEHNYSFGDFLKKSTGNELHILPQTFYTNSGSDNNRTLSYIGKYENFDNDLKIVLNKLNIENVKIPHLNKNPIYDKHPNLKQEKYYKYFYTEQWMKDWVKERYKDDFKQFNYELEI